MCGTPLLSPCLPNSHGRRRLPLATKPATLDQLDLNNWQVGPPPAAFAGQIRVPAPRPSSAVCPPTASTHCLPPCPCTHPPPCIPTGLRQEGPGAAPDWARRGGRHHPHPAPLLAGLARRQDLLRLLLRMRPRAAAAGAPWAASARVAATRGLCSAVVLRSFCEPRQPLQTCTQVLCDTNRRPSAPPVRATGQEGAHPAVRPGRPLAQGPGPAGLRRRAGRLGVWHCAGGCWWWHFGCGVVLPCLTGRL